VIHTCSFIDRIERRGGRLMAGGVAFSGTRAIMKVQVRPEGGEWIDAVLEPRLSGFTLTRWKAEVDGRPGAAQLEARAQDDTGAWQSAVERPLFPDGMAGPTRKRIPS
jgi:hypothetical protein